MIFPLGSAGHSLTWQVALLSCLVTFVLSNIIAFTYERTFRGLSWSQGLVQALVLGSIVSCLLMLAIGDNIARGIGIVGSLAIIRFRTNLRDPRDMVFIFAALGVGVAAGVQSFSTAVIGSAVFCAATIYLRIAPFGARTSHDGLLRFQLPADHTQHSQIEAALGASTRRFALVTVREVAQGQRLDYAYQLKLRRPESAERLIADIRDLDGIQGVTFHSQRATVEV